MYVWQKTVTVLHENNAGKLMLNMLKYRICDIHVYSRINTTILVCMLIVTTCF